MPPEGPNPNFDFIMKEAPKPRRSLGLPTNLPKPALIAIGAVIAIFLIIIAASLLGGGGSSNTDKLYGLLSDAGQIIATSSEATTSAQDPDTANIAATAKETLSAQQQSIENYIESKGTKIDDKRIANSVDPNTESELKNATANNNYDQVFLNYLKSAMNSYQSNLQSTYQTAGSSLKSILSNAYNSNAIILNSQQLK